MKSKLNLRVSSDEHSSTEIELEITDQRVTGITQTKKGSFGMSHFPEVNDDVKVSMMDWCTKTDNWRREVKLPSEPESAYRKVESIGQLGDSIGLGRVD